MNNYLIKKCFEEKQVISISYDEEAMQESMVGYIGAYNDSELLLYSITSRGIYDGYIVLKMEDISQLSYGGRFEKAAETLYQMRRIKHKSVSVKDDQILYSLLNFSKKMGYVVLIETEVEILQGILLDYIDCESETICLNVLTDWGGEEGSCEIMIDKIRELSIDTQAAQDIRFLKEKDEKRKSIEM